MQQIGLEAVFLTAAFAKGLDVYIKGTKKAQDATIAVAATGNEIGAVFGGKMGTALQVASVGFGIVGNAAIVATAAIAAGVVAATTAVIGFSVAMLNLGLRAKDVEGVEFAFNRMASTVGLSLDQLRTSSGNLVSDFDLMRVANRALSGSGEELAKRFGQDLPKVLEIARAGAKATGMSFDYVFEKLVTGIKLVSPKRIDDFGLTLKVGEANEQLAASIGKTVDQLSQEEKQIAVLNAVLAKGDQFISTFAGAGETLGAKIGQSQATIKNIALTIGQFFVPALKTVVDAINRLLQAFQASIAEGGTLYNVFVLLGAVFSFVADGFAAGVDMLLGFVDDTAGGIEDRLMDAINAAFDWGLDFIFNFAEGIINGATTVLQGAINFVSGILGGWFSPGSPPRIAPLIDEWGTATMNEFLTGFTKADFDILKTMQAPLKSILDVFSSAGAYTKAQAKQLFVDISKSFIEGTATGDLSSTYDQITQAAGMYGAELVKLIKLNQSLANAQKQVAAAEKAVTDARNKEQKLNSSLTMQLLEYNDLVRAGASPDVLAAKLAGINSTQDQLIATKDEVAAAEEQSATAKENLDSVKEQVDLQKELIDTLIDLAKAQDEVRQAQLEAAKQPTTRKAGGGAPTIPTDEDFGFDWTGIGESLQEKLGIAIDVAKIIIYAKLKELWNNIVFQFQTRLQPAIDAFRAKWEELKEIIRPAIDWISAQIAWATNLWKEWWAKHGEDVKLIWSTFWGAIGEVLQGAWNFVTNLIGSLLAVIQILWINGWAALKPYLSEVWEFIKSVVEGAMNFVGNVIGVVAALIRTDWDLFWENVKTKASDTWELIKSTVSTKVAEIKTSVTTWISEVKTAWDEFWDGINTKATDIWTTLVDTIKLKIAEIVTAWEGFKQDFTDPFTSAWNGIKSAVEGVIKKIGEFVDKFKNVKLPWWLTPGSPTPFEIGLRGISDAMSELALNDIPSLRYSLANSPMTPAMAGQPISTNYNNTANVNMGGVNVYNGMGTGELESTIRRVLRTELGA